MDLQKLFEALSDDEQKKMYHISRKKYENNISIIDFINKHKNDLSLRAINCLKATCNYYKNYPDDENTKHYISEIWDKNKELSRQKIYHIRGYGKKTHSEMVKILVNIYGYQL